MPWDTEALGFPVAAITRLDIEGQRSPGAFTKLWDWAADQGIRMISCRLPADALSAAFLLQAQGFRFIETVLRPIRRNLQQLRLPEDSLTICEVTQAEVESVRAMAERSFGFERFHSDPRLDPAAADRRYGNWVRNALDSPSQVLLKVEDAGRIVAFFIVEETGTAQAYWHLTAVHPELTRQGYGRRAWRAMLAHHQRGGIDRVTTTITARNVPVLNLYASLQFTFLAPQLTFHWLADGAGQAGA